MGHLNLPTEKSISISIDNSSVFFPGGGAGQYGFRRTEFIAQKPANGTAELNVEMETGVTVFHFSIKLDTKKPLNYSHEYQIVFIEPNDGTHVFDIQLGRFPPSFVQISLLMCRGFVGSPFTNPTGILPAPNAHSFKIRNHALDVLFTTPFLPFVWHNFAVQVDWDYRTLAAFYSKDHEHLLPITNGTVPNSSVNPGATGEFHFGVLKVAFKPFFLINNEIINRCQSSSPW